MPEIPSWQLDAILEALLEQQIGTRVFLRGEHCQLVEQLLDHPRAQTTLFLRAARAMKRRFQGVYAPLEIRVLEVSAFRTHPEARKCLIESRARSILVALLQDGCQQNQEAAFRSLAAYHPQTALRLLHATPLLIQELSARALQPLLTSNNARLREQAIRELGDLPGTTPEPVA